MAAGLQVRGEKLPEGTNTPRPTTSGRGLFATRAFAPGETVAEYGEPLVVVPFAAAAARTCNWCLDVRRPARACTGCRAVGYCGSRCQKADWAVVHKKECKALRTKSVAGAASGTSVGLQAPVRALLQILLRWDDVQAAVDGLSGNIAGFRARTALWKDFAAQAEAACQLAGRRPSVEELSRAAEVLCKIHTNAFDRSDADVGYSGSFLDAGLAMVNHSCVPNAVVAFFGRQAYLRAEQAIAVGDEVTISYIDYTKPKTARQAGLDLYHFTCTCPRCAGDLDVYQVCRTSPLVGLNAFSFVPDVDRLRDPPLNAQAPGISAAALDQLYATCRPEQPVAPTARLAYLRRAWAACAPLVAAGRWAVEPLAHVLQQVIILYSEQQRFAEALAVECFVAQHCDPYKYVAPFAQWRLKGLLLIAKTVTNTQIEAPSPSASALQYAIASLGDGALYEAILLMVLRYGPMGHSARWELLDTARDMLADVQSVPGRTTLTAALRHWTQDPTEPAAARFFRENVLPPVEQLAGLAMDLVRADLE